MSGATGGGALRAAPGTSTEATPLRFVSAASLFEHLKRSFHFTLDNSGNVSLGPTSKTRFDAGKLQDGQSTTTLDLFREITWWRKAPLRLEAETIRDAMLEASGRLNLAMGGPGVFPPLPPGVVTRGGWKANEDPAQAARRSGYIFVRRKKR